MRKTILSAIALSFTFSVFSQEVYIPDPDFKRALIQSGVDKDKDGALSYTECAVVSSLGIQKENIADLTGIEAFVNLRILICDNNLLSSLDLSACKNLRTLYCRFNQLTQLNISGCDSLKSLYCSSNLLENIDISSLYQLNTLVCFDNLMSSLDCSNKELTLLSVSPNPHLKFLNCENNKLTGIYLAGLPVLEFLNCNGNQLNNLDISANLELKSLQCGSNPISDLELYPHTKLFSELAPDSFGLLDLSNMPYLGKVCVSQLPFPPVDKIERLDTTGSTGIYFTNKACDAQIIDFPDTNFRNALLSIGVDKNGDGIITGSECHEISDLDISSAGISDLTGVEAFTNLANLNCSDNYLTELNLSGCGNLQSLHCDSNQLTSLDVTKCLSLYELTCSSNFFESLNLSNNTYLPYYHRVFRRIDASNMPTLYEVCVWWDLLCIGAKLIIADGSPNIIVINSCTGLVTIPDEHFKNALISLGLDTNQDGEISFRECKGLRNLDVNGQGISDLTGIDAFTDLENLNCSGNQLTHLRLPFNTSLQTLNCSGNILDTLEIYACKKLKVLDCSNNQLSKVSVDANTDLVTLRCGGNPLTGLCLIRNRKLLTSLPGTGYGVLDISNLPSLHEVCVWETPFPTVNNPGEIITTGSSQYFFISQDCMAPVYFANSGFKNYIIEIYAIDIDGDGEISYKECTGITELSLPVLFVWGNCSFGDITGLEAFIDLETLAIPYGGIPRLDLYENNKLKYLDVSGACDLTEVCVSEQGADLELIDNTGQCPHEISITTSCSDSAQISDIPETSIRQSSLLPVYPNPSNGFFTVPVENPSETIIEVHTICGLRIYSQHARNKKEIIDLSDCPEGIYFVKTIQPGKIMVGKMILH
jgi:hypothetical protein